MSFIDDVEKFNVSAKAETLQKDLSGAGFTGKEYSFSRGPTVNGIVRFHLAKDRVYILEAIGEAVTKQAHTKGTVVLQGVFSSTGHFTNVRVLSELPHGLTERAIEAAGNIRFIPAMKDGRYVSMYIQLEYNFNVY